MFLYRTIIHVNDCLSYMLHQRGPLRGWDPHMIPYAINKVIINVPICYKQKSNFFAFFSSVKAFDIFIC